MSLAMHLVRPVAVVVSFAVIGTALVANDPVGPVPVVEARFTDGSGVISFDTFNNPNLAVPDRGTAITVSFPPEACLVLDKAEVAAAAAPEDLDAA